MSSLTVARAKGGMAQVPENKTKEKGEEESEEQKINFQVLYETSTEYINNQDAWKNLESVKVRIAELNNQLKKDTDPTV